MMCTKHKRLRRVYDICNVLAALPLLAKCRLATANRSHSGYRCVVCASSKLCLFMPSFARLLLTVTGCICAIAGATVVLDTPDRGLT